MIAAAGRERVLHVDAFRPDPGLDGLPLAAPSRRILAFALEVALLLLPSVIIAIAASFTTPAVVDGDGFDAVRRLLSGAVGVAALDRRPRAASNHAGVLVPPPFFFVAAFLAGLVLDRIVPLPVLPVVIARTMALPLLAIAAGLLAWSAARFWRARTSMLPFRPSTALVTEGPYRFTRNPMYVAMLCAYMTTALWFGWTGPLLLAPLAMLVVGRVVIAREERYLERTFGDEYRRYRGSVRRWL